MLFSEEKCPNCGSSDYEVDIFWDDFDEDGGRRVWECVCSSCYTRFNIMYEYKCIGTTVEVSES